MNKPITYIFLIIAHILIAQDIKTLTPSIELLEFSKEGEHEFNRNWKVCEAIWEKMQNGVEYKDLTAQEQKDLEKVSEVHSDYWQVGTDGCSWYCGASIAMVSASSYLNTQGKTSYVPKNAHDFDYKNAWVEGVNGYGVGEFLEFSFPQENPRITKISIVNGYVKSEKAWIENSRVKKLKMYIDDVPYAILNLKDERATNHFEVDPIGNADRDNYEELAKLPDWTMKFEILEVYPGEKYEDTVISEIYFDGIDVHCFAKGTLITMADHTQKSIELLALGDEVLSYNQQTQQQLTATIKELANPIHDNLITISLEDGTSITCTIDHPLMSATGDWLSYDPQKTKADYIYNSVGKLEVGAMVLGVDKDLKIVAITTNDKMQPTYTIVRLDKGNTFYANGILVGTEELREQKVCEKHQITK
ncbi:hypothetical protein [uncultured Aquimarina sp.]|uniref:NADase-type glycan-binding domain-containing protein n=1 Tax=uncultured Aquimarina sp. TaxID=575652 RepID=UPI00261BC12E|nr:hypothetical protein [uncultured Aquimarina sp.]